MHHRKRRTFFMWSGKRTALETLDVFSKVPVRARHFLGSRFPAALDGVLAPQPGRVHSHDVVHREGPLCHRQFEGTLSGIENVPRTRRSCGRFREQDVPTALGKRGCTSGDPPEHHGATSDRREGFHQVRELVRPRYCCEGLRVSSGRFLEPIRSRL